jgi:hypothetical protein
MLLGDPPFSRSSHGTDHLETRSPSNFQVQVREHRCTSAPSHSRAAAKTSQHHNFNQPQQWPPNSSPPSCASPQQLAPSSPPRPLPPSPPPPPSSPAALSPRHQLSMPLTTRSCAAAEPSKQRESLHLLLLSTGQRCRASV